MKTRNLMAIVSAMVMSMVAGTVQAADLTWDHDKNGTASDGGGTWLTASQWLNGGTPATWNNTTPDNAIIGSGTAGGTITLGTVTAGTVLLNNFTGTYTLSGTALTNNGSITIGATAGSVIISSPIKGTGSVTNNGAGTLTLSGANTYSGGFTLNAGIVGSIGSGTYNGFGTGTVTINGGRILVASGANVTILNAMKWNSNFIVDRGASSPPTINWNGNITLGANVTVGGSAAGGAYNQIFNGNILDDITGGRSLSFTTIGVGGRDYITLKGNNTYTGNTSIDRGSLTIGGSGRLGGGDYSGNIGISTTADAPITYSSNSDQVLRGVVSGVSGLTKDTSSTSVLTLFGANTYAGNTVISAGTLKLGAANVIPDGSGKGNVTVAGTLDLNTFSETINGLSGSGTVDTFAGGTPTLTVGGNSQTSAFSGIIKNTAGTLGITKTGTGTLTLSGANNYSGLTTVSDGTLIMTTTSTLGGLTIAANKAFIYAPAAAGALNLGGALTISSGTTTSIGTALGGTLSESAIISSGAASLAGTGVVNIRLTPGVTPAAGTHNLITATSGLTGGTYTLGKVYNNTDFTLANFTRSATAISVDVVSATPLSGNAYWKGGLAGNTGVWSASDGSGTSNWQAPNGTAQGLVPGATADLVFSASTSPGTMVGMTLGANMSVRTITINNTATAFGLTADGNTLTLGTGGITIASGVQASSIATPVILAAAQTWLNNSANALTVNGGINNNGNLLTIDGSGTINFGTSTLSGAGGLSKNGTGYLNMQTTTHSMTGSLVINGGELMVQNAQPLPSGNITLDGGVLVGYWGDTWTRSLGSAVGQIQVLGGVSGFCGQGSTGVTLKFNNDTNYEVVWGAANEAGNVNATGYFNPSTLVLQSPIANQNGVINFQNKINLNGTTRTILVNKDHGATGGNATISGVIRTSSGTAGITKTGVGKLIFSVANTYNGDSTVSAGTLQLSAANTGNQSSVVTIATGAKLALSFAGTDTVKQLVLGTAYMQPGVYGHTSSGANNGGLGVGVKDAFFATGTGTLTVTDGPPPPKGTLIQLY